MSNQTLTEDQQKFLAECEAEFANRYTEEDKDYQQVKAGGVGSPPIVYPWFARDRGGGGGRRGGGGGGYHRNNDRDRYRDRERGERRDYRDRSPDGGRYDERAQSHHRHREGGGRAGYY